MTQMKMPPANPGRFTAYCGGIVDLHRAKAIEVHPQDIAVQSEQLNAIDALIEDIS